MNDNGEYDLTVRQNPLRARLAGGKEKGRVASVSLYCIFFQAGNAVLTMLVYFPIREEAG